VLDRAAKKSYRNPLTIARWAVIVAEYTNRGKAPTENKMTANKTVSKGRFSNLTDGEGADAPAGNDTNKYSFRTNIDSAGGDRSFKTFTHAGIGKVVRFSPNQGQGTSPQFLAVSEAPALIEFLEDYVAADGDFTPSAADTARNTIKRLPDGGISFSIGEGDRGSKAIKVASLDGKGGLVEFIDVLRDMTKRLS